MKLRLQSNSIRLRLKRGEVAQFAQTGRVEEKIVIGSEPGDVFTYVLESSRTISEVKANLTKQVMLYRFRRKLFTSGQPATILELKQFFRQEKKLQVLIEKDFACLNGPEELNIDTFPNPLAGTKC